MGLHPAFHLEIARQRQHDLRAAAGRHRIARAIGALGSSHSDPRVESQGRGELLYLRQLDAFDRQALIEAFSRLSRQGRYWRYGVAKAELTDADLDRLTDVDPPRSDAFGAFRSQGDELVGFAQYAGGDDPTGPELGVVVVDDWQRRGVGTVLANLMIARARTSRHPMVHAQVLADNLAALRFVRRLGFRSAARDGLFVVHDLALL